MERTKMPKVVGTHNSATSLPSGGWGSVLVAPFSRCQRLSLEEQYAAGCRDYDFRVRLLRGRWVFAHGLWHSAADVRSTLRTLDAYVDGAEREETMHGRKVAPTFFSVTYEGHMERDGVSRDEFGQFVVDLWLELPSLVLTEVMVKHPAWRVIAYNAETAHEFPKLFKAYDVLTLKPWRWRTLLPVPLLWAALRRLRPMRVSAGYVPVLDDLRP